MSFHLFIYFFSFIYFGSHPLALRPLCQLPPLPQPPSWCVVVTSLPPHTCHVQWECELAAAVTPQGKHLPPFKAPRGTTLTLSHLTVVPQPQVSTCSDPPPATLPCHIACPATTSCHPLPLLPTPHRHLGTPCHHSVQVPAMPHTAPSPCHTTVAQKSLPHHPALHSIPVHMT
jgi:hypothetical protein